jgi:HAE1 family hydrophobic/amphiphilic exporter-1
VRDQRKLEEALPRFSLNRRIAVLVMLASALVVGVVATIGIPLELIPSGFNNPFLGIRVPWRDAPPQEMLEKIILPLEEEVSTVAGIDGIRSYARTGIAFISLRFKTGTDMDVAYRELRDRIERARVRMPEDADRITIRKEDDASIPVMVLGLTVDPGLIDPYNLIQNQIIMPLQRIDGVATVEVQGLMEKEILIELDRERTEASGLNIYQLAGELADDNFTLASGDVRFGGKKLLLRSVARYKDLEALRQRLVAPSIRLKDIADVSWKEPEQTYRVRANSQPAVSLIVLKEGQANTIDVARAMRAELERLEGEPRLQDIGIFPLFDQGQVIEESLKTLLDSGRIGALFAVVVLFFFLRRLRLTLIITLSIPLSLLISLTVMYFANESLNILSLLGLMISVGLLVDNSVVVAENVHRLHKEGMRRRDAAIKGVGEIAMAILMATLTTIVVFLPVSLVEGQGQFFLLRLSLPISMALLASLVVAGVFVPLCVYLTLANGVKQKTRLRGAYDRFTAFVEVVYNHTLGRMNRGYTSLLGVFLKRRFDLVLLLVLLYTVTGAVAFKHVDFVDVQEEERSGFEIDIEMPRGTTLEETEVYFRSLEEVVQEHMEELDLDGQFHFHTATYGELEGWFKRPRTNDISPREVTERLMELIPKKPGAEYFTGQESESEEEEGQQVFVVELFGEDFRVLDRVAGEIEDRFIAVPGVLGLKSSGDPAPNELGLVVDRGRAQQQGINPQVVAGVVGYALRGQQLPYYHRDGKEIPVRVRYKEEDRETLDKLKGFYVPTASGGAVPLSSVTEVHELASAERIVRSNKRTTQTLTLELEEGKEEETRKSLLALQSSIDLPEGVRFGEQRGEEVDEDLAAMQFALLLSVVFIYLLMGFLFESFMLPLSIIFSIILAPIGVSWIHFAFGFDIDFLGVVGCILLVGVVVNNGIVLIDYVNRLRKQGMERREALLMATERRFRPIMMTTLTTICGLIPVTMSGTSSIGLSYTSFGLTLIGGLISSTLFTLLVVPVVYTLLDDMRTIVVAALFRRMSWGRKAAPATVADPDGWDG